MIRAVVDTNIIVSGLLFRGLPSKVVNAAIDRRFTWVTSPYLIEELERVLGYKKSQKTKASIVIVGFAAATGLLFTLYRKLYLHPVQRPAWPFPNDKCLR